MDTTHGCVLVTATDPVAATSGWRGLGRFSSDPIWRAVSLYTVGESLLVHRSRSGVIAEVRRETGGRVFVHDRRIVVELALHDDAGLVGRVVYPPRTRAVARLRALGWIRAEPVDDDVPGRPPGG